MKREAIEPAIPVYRVMMTILAAIPVVRVFPVPAQTRAVAAVLDETFINRHRDLVQAFEEH